MNENLTFCDAGAVRDGCEFGIGILKHTTLQYNFKARVD